MKPDMLDKPKPASRRMCAFYCSSKRFAPTDGLDKTETFNIRFSEPARLSTRRKPFVLTKTAGQQPTIKVFHTNHRVTKRRNSDAWLRLWTALSLDVDGVVAQDFKPHRLYFVDARDRAD